MVNPSAPSSIAPRTRTGCQNCRLRHLKCDDRKPACSRCEKVNIECVRGYNIRFKHGGNPSVANLKGSGLAKTDYDFSDTQPWVRTDRTLTFLDETPELNSLYERDDGDNISYGPTAKSQAPAVQPSPPSRTGHTSSSQHSPYDGILQAAGTPSNHGSVNADSSSVLFGIAESRFNELTSPEKRRRITPTPGSGSYHGSYHRSSAHASPDHSIPTPHDLWNTSSLIGWTPTTIEPSIDIGPHNASIDPSFAGLEPTASYGTSTPFNGMSNSFSRIYLNTPVWPLQDREEARLLRHFVEHLARSFDLTDPMRHFRRVVPQRAAICPALLNAIFALSARHLSRIGEYDHLISNKYIQECLKHLIPMLDDNSALLDENILASTIILRHCEEFEIPISGQQQVEKESHLFGAQAFITAQEHATITGGLRQAAFWVGLRQEMYVAFVNQRSIIPALEHCNIDRSFEAASDDIWACRMVVLHADVIRYCFDDNDHPPSTYTYLADNCKQWVDSKPSSFTPIYERPAGAENVFPEIQYMADEVVTGMQHYYLARILLVAHNPKIPRLGPSRTAALRAADDEVIDYVRLLCGICLSNPETSPNFIYASQAIVIAGDKFTDPREQAAVLDVLETTDRKHAWMTQTAQVNLKTAWGWVDD